MAALTTLRLYRKTTDLLPASEWADKILALLDEKNIGVLTSVSALVTYGRMKGGGACSMISRSLGPAFGGSSGILFWLTYCVNVTFNTRAFSDTIFSTFFADQSKNWSGSEAFWYEFAFSTGTLFLLFLILLL